MAQNNHVCPIRVTGYTAEGAGVGRADGQVVFLPGALEGEQVDARIVHAGKTHAVGRIVRVTEPSPHRIAPDCPYYGRCGGCDLRHMDYEEELRFKTRKVLDALNRIGGAELDAVPILGAEKTERYRNKAMFPVGWVGGQADAGFYRAGSHEIIPVTACRLQAEAADRAREAVVSWMRKYSVPAYDESTGRGLVRHVYVRSAFATGQTLVCVVVRQDAIPHEAELVFALRAAVPDLTTAVICVNAKPGNVVLGTDYRTLFGPGFLEDELCSLRFRLSPRSFYQVNRDQAERLYGLALDLADLSPSDTALDLYCGTGTITLALAKRCGQAVGVEIVAEAIEDAKENARRNGIENARFFRADAGEAAVKLAAEGVAPDVIVVDPPRKGLAPDVVETAAAMAPKRIVYVSCDPATLARDVARFREHGYDLSAAHAVDLFPRTKHVETVALMSRV